MSAVAPLLVDDDEPEYDLTLPQSQFLALDAKYPLFIGGYGSGKTYIRLLNALLDLLQYPGADIGLYDPTYDLIDLNTQPRLLELLDAHKLRYTENKQKYLINVRGFGKFIMRSMDNPKRIIAYQVFRSHIDELETLATPERILDAWRKVIARNRQRVANPITGAFGENRVSVYTTPDTGFGFTYNHWAKDPKPGYVYVRAPTITNPYNGEDYIDGLSAAYPKAFQKAFLDGIWTNLTTGTVYPEFDRVLNGTTRVLRDNDKTIHVGMDFNVNNMSAIVHVVENEDAFGVDELTNGRDTPSIIVALKERFQSGADHDRQIVVYPDATGNKAGTTNASTSDIQLLTDAGFFVDAPPSNPFVKNRVLSLNSKICNGQNDRQYFINPTTCPESTANLEQQPYDRNGVPDKGHNKDHTNDAIGYFVHRLWPIKRIGAYKTGDYWK